MWTIRSMRPRCDGSTRMRQRAGRVELSLPDTHAVDTTRIHGPKQLTDVYLLALAVARGGRLATFDRSVSLAAVAGAQQKHIVVI
jgi:uncharacterized protein